MKRERHEMYKEILLLEHLLQKEEIPYQIENLFDGYCIGIPNLFEPETKISVIEHFGSYGSAFDTVEIQTKCGGVRGFLKAGVALEIIRDEYERGARKWTKKESKR